MMVSKRSIIGFIVSCLCAASTQAGVTSIELVPQTRGLAPDAGPVEVDVVLHNQEGQAIQPRLITLDFSATDPTLMLPDTFHFQLAPPLLGDFLYTRFETMPKVDIVYSSTVPQPGFILGIPDGGSLLLGTISVQLSYPYGTFTLDAINAGAPDMNSGARIDYGFDYRVTLHTLNQNLAGGTVDLYCCIPEPATIALFAVGAMGLMAGRSRGSRWVQ